MSRHDDSGVGESVVISPLSLASDAELFAELNARHPAVLLCVLESEKGVQQTNYFFNGGFSCVGMAQAFVHEYVNGKIPCGNWTRPE